MTTRFWIPILTAFVCFGAVNEASAKERTADQFKEYVSRRMAKVDEKQLATFLASVDKNDDGVISDQEFAARIDVFQKVFKNKAPKASGGGHDLPENWQTDYEVARKKSSESGKPILAMFSASWCGPCKAMIARVYPTDAAKKALKDFVPVYIDSEKQQTLAQDNDIRAFPTFVCFDVDGKVVEKHVGASDTDGFVKLLTSFRKAASQEDEVSQKESSREESKDEE